VVCFTSAVSTHDEFNLTALYQKNSSKAESPAVSQAASSEYVHQLDILLFSVRDIVKVFGTKVGRILVSQRYTSLALLSHTYRFFISLSHI
jgi:hypothetical protein